LSQERGKNENAVNLFPKEGGRQGKKRKGRKFFSVI